MWWVALVTIALAIQQPHHCVPSYSHPNKLLCIANLNPVLIPAQKPVDPNSTYVLDGNTILPCEPSDVVVPGNGDPPFCSWERLRQDVPAVRKKICDPVQFEFCGTSIGVTGELCQLGPETEHCAFRWTCSDKSRVLLTAQDGTKHCVKF